MQLRVVKRKDQETAICRMHITSLPGLKGARHLAAEQQSCSVGRIAELLKDLSAQDYGYKIKPH